jgi:hypothetical protein
MEWLEGLTPLLVDALIIFAIIAGLWTLRQLRKQWITEAEWAEIKRAVLAAEKTMQDQTGLDRKKSVELAILAAFPNIDRARLELYIEAAVKTMEIMERYPNLPHEAAQRSGN